MLGYALLLKFLMLIGLGCLIFPLVTVLSDNILITSK